MAEDNNAINNANLDGVKSKNHLHANDKNGAIVGSANNNSHKRHHDDNHNTGTTHHPYQFHHHHRQNANINHNNGNSLSISSSMISAIGKESISDAANSVCVSTATHLNHPSHNYPITIAPADCTGFISFNKDLNCSDISNVNPVTADAVAVNSSNLNLSNHANPTASAKRQRTADAGCKDPNAFSTSPSFVSKSSVSSISTLKTSTTNSLSSMALSYPASSSIAITAGMTNEPSECLGKGASFNPGFPGMDVWGGVGILGHNRGGEGHVKPSIIPWENERKEGGGGTRIGGTGGTGSSMGGTEDVVGSIDGVIVGSMYGVVDSIDDVVGSIDDVVGSIDNVVGSTVGGEERRISENRNLSKVANSVNDRAPSLAMHLSANSNERSTTDTHVADAKATHPTPCSNIATNHIPTTLINDHPNHYALFTSKYPINNLTSNCSSNGDLSFPHNPFSHPSLSLQLRDGSNNGRKPNSL
eukprot:CAMPEP_0175081546 /NCGR_PEP_ID=MMETSP0052_2-20121109/26213_1 /TAXON_ID=51329 ORGANISM="Polytomella parva, Strain SAG 63-3" /NCGR_SAMPLE_ID=MMETSP0052_2 /ASSEMBLY_ACC=CAM_ASM_000194 /LENGTH=473 /DNA_ID=CAMNT_0016352549 /DNA_START=112 /DNA_END=1530 /DNA_ORIENTATION=+